MVKAGPDGAVFHIKVHKEGNAWQNEKRRAEGPVRMTARWRMLGTGPVYLKLGSRVLYRIDEIEAHELRRTRRCTDGSNFTKVRM
jgi:hypothetical protein